MRERAAPFREGPNAASVLFGRLAKANPTRHIEPGLNEKDAGRDSGQYVASLMPDFDLIGNYQTLLVAHRVNLGNRKIALA